MSQKTYRAGEIVWAKMRGHPAWPAKVARPPKGVPRPPGKLWIFFYGTHEHAWMMTADLFSYEENKEKFCLPKKIKGFAEAIWEVEEDPDLVITLGKPPSKRRKRSTSKHGNKEESCQVTTATSTVPLSLSQDCEGVQSAEHLFPPTLTAAPPPTAIAAHSPTLTTTSCPTFTGTHPPTLTATPYSTSTATCSPTFTAMHSTFTATPSPTITATFLPPDFTSSDKPRYTTRRRKCRSDGIVAQITQSFAARMELKSPRNRDASSSPSRQGQAGCDPTQEVRREVVTDKERQTDDTEEPEVKVEHSVGNSESVEPSRSAVVMLEERERRALKKGKEGPKRAPQRVSRRATRSSGRLARKTADKGNCPDSETPPKAEDQVQESYREACAGPGVDVHGSEEVNCSSEKMCKEVMEAELHTNTGERLEGGSTVEHEDGETTRETEVHVAGEMDPGVGKPEELIATHSSAAEIDKENVSDTLVNSISQIGVDSATNTAVDPMPGETAPPEPLASCGEGRTVRVKGEPEKEEASTGSQDLQLLHVEKSMSAVDTLMILNYNLKASLTVHSPDVHGAKAVLRELLSLEYTSRDLHRVPDLVASVRKVRRYHGNEMVRSTAEDVYSAMKSVFVSPGHPPPPPRGRASVVARGKRPMMISKTQGATAGHAPSRVALANKSGSAPSRQGANKKEVPKVPPVEGDTKNSGADSSGDQFPNCDGVLVGMTVSASEDQTVPASDL